MPNDYILRSDVEKMIQEKIQELYKARKTPGIISDSDYTTMIVGVDEIREGLSSIQSVDVEKEIKDMIDSELDPEGTLINEKRLRCLEDILGKIKGEPPFRNNIT